MKKILIISLLILSSLAVFSSDLIIDSKTQTFSDKERKIKLDGGVKVKLDNLTVESDRADVTIRRNNKLDTATFYDKPYAYEINENKTPIYYEACTDEEILSYEYTNNNYVTPDAVQSPGKVIE